MAERLVSNDDVIVAANEPRRYNGEATGTTPDDSSGDIVFRTSGVERARINASGVGSGLLGGFVNIKSLGAVADGVTDVAPFVVTAISQLTALGGGVLYFPPGVWAARSDIGAALTDVENIKLLGSRAPNTVYNGAPTAGTIIRATVAMTNLCTWTPSANSQSLRGNGIESIAFDANGQAQTALKLASQYGGTWRDIYAYGGLASGIVLTTVNLSGVEDMQENLFEQVTASVFPVAAAKGIVISSWQAGGGNVSLNSFNRIFTYSQNGTGIEIGDADGNTFTGVYCNRSGTAIGIDLLGSSSAGGGHARHNTILGYEGPGGVTSRATGMAQVSGPNLLIQTRGNSTGLPTVEAGAVLTWLDNYGRSNGFTSDFRRTRRPLVDDFESGATGAQTLGDLGWNIIASTSGTFTRLASIASHPGIIQVATGTTASSIPSMTTGTNGTLGAPLPSEMFELNFVLLLEQNDVNTQVRFGMAGTANGNPDADGIYFEKLAADTSWFGVCRGSSAQTRSSAVASCDTSYHRFRIRRIDTSTIGFSIDDGTEQTVTTHVPTAALLYFLQITNNSTAASKAMDVDYFESNVTGLNR